MIFIQSHHKIMRSEELVQELADINSCFVNDINVKLIDLPEKFNEFISKYDKVYSELQQCKCFNFHLLTRVNQLKRNVVTNSLYGRKETVKLNLVPAEMHKDFSDEKG